MSMKIANDAIRNRIRAHPNFSALSQPTATRRAQSIYIYIYIYISPPITPHVLMNFRVSLLVVAIVKPTSEFVTPMRRDYVVPMM